MTEIFAFPFITDFAKNDVRCGDVVILMKCYYWPCVVCVCNNDCVKETQPYTDINCIWCERFLECKFIRYISCIKIIKPM